MKRTLFFFAVLLLSLWSVSGCRSSDYTHIDADLEQDTDWVDCETDSVTEGGDADIDSNNDADIDGNNDADIEENIIACNALDYDPGAMFGLYPMPTILPLGSVLPISSWTILDFSFDAIQDVLLITGLWVNKLPVCACGYVDSEGRRVSYGDAKAKEYADTNGIGQGSGILTLRLNLTNGESHAIGRSIGEVTYEPYEPNSMTGQTFQIEILRDSGAMSLELEAVAGYDLRGCPTSNLAQTRQVMAIRNSSFGEYLFLCGEDTAAEPNCDLPIPTEYPLNVSVKTPGGYLCNASSCSPKPTR